MGGNHSSGRKPYVEPTDKTCPHCGLSGMTRQKLVVHEPICEKNPKNVKSEPVKTPLIKSVDTNQQEIIPEKPDKITVVGDYPDEEAGDIATMEEPESEIPYILLIPVILLIMLAVGLLIFRDKVRAIFNRWRRPPIMGVPQYVG
jgi:hypothetical protein